METQDIYNMVYDELKKVLETPEPDFISAIVTGLELVLDSYVQCHKFIFFVDETAEIHLICMVTIMTIPTKPRSMLLDFMRITKEKFAEYESKLSPGSSLYAVIGKT